MVDAEGSRNIALRHENDVYSAQTGDTKALREDRKRRRGIFLSGYVFVFLGYISALALLALGPDESLAITALLLIMGPLSLWAVVSFATSGPRWAYVRRIFEPGWTYWCSAILLGVSAIIAIPIIQSLGNGNDNTIQSLGNGNKNEVFVEVRVAAVFTLATFIPVVIALFLQGKPSMRIERGWIVWRSSFGVATGFYALLLGVAGVVAIFEIALADGVPDWVAYLGVVTFFLVIFMLPVLLVSVAVCSGAPFTSQSAKILVGDHLRANRKEKAKGLIKDLRDVTIVEYKQDNRRAVRERLQALGDISKNDDFDVKEASLEEIGFVGSEMILDRDLAREAIEVLVSESKNRQRADTIDWSDSFINKQISELMSIWARAVEQKASPLLVDMCAQEIKDILGNGNFHRQHGNLRDRELDRKLDAIVAAYEDNVHEESGLLLTLKTFGHFKDFPDTVLDKLSEESKSPVKALTELFLETDKPLLDRYDRDVELFVKKSDNLPSKSLSRSIPFTSLQELAKQSHEHRKLIAKSCNWYVTDPEANATGQATANGYLALVLKMVKRAEPKCLPDEAKQSLMDLMQIEAGGRKFQNWEPSQLRSIVTPNLMQLLPEMSDQLTAQELARDETLPALRKVVLQLLVQSWGAHLEEQGESASESDKANQQWLLDQIRQYTRSLPSGTTERFKSVIEGLSSQLEKYGRPLFAELSSFDVFASSPQFEDQKKVLAKVHGLHEELLEQNIPEYTYFDERRWTFADKKVLLEGLATTRLNLTENVAAKRLSLDEQIPYRGMHIRVRDAQVAVVEIDRLVREAPGGERL